MDAQARFWREMYHLRGHACYLQLYLAKTERIDRAVNIGIAVTSTSSLSMWAFLKQFDMLWAGLIVVSQLVAMIKSYLPYKSRVKALASCVHEYEGHMVWAEGKWFEIADGRLTEQEIVSLRSELQKRTNKTMRTCFPTSALPDDDALLTKAVVRADSYFKVFYGSMTDDNSEETTVAPS